MNKSIMILYNDIMIHGDQLDQMGGSKIITFYIKGHMIFNIFTDYQYLKYDTTLDNGTVVYELLDII